MAELLAKFVAAFKRGIEGELAAVRSAAEAFEITLVRGEDLGALRFAFDVAATDRLAAGTVCALKTARGDQRVTIERIVDTRVTLVALQAIDTAEPCALLVAPWFLYERLTQALDGITEAPLALTLFGKEPPTRVPTTLQRDHGTLNASQQQAVTLCAESNLAFVWGPPGTGKTATLVHVIDELLARGERILIASTTNAAIDQLIAKLSKLAWFAPGTVVRLGRSEAETFGTELHEIVDGRQGAGRARIARLRARIGECEQQIKFAKAMAEELVPAVTLQQSLFTAPPPRLRATALERVFGGAAAIAALDARAQAAVLQQRITRLERVRVLAKARVSALLAEDRDVEAKLVAAARVVMCTLANTYVSPLLAHERFDVLIAEEAGMATLPPLFYAASLCRARAIMVGDPRQLPPIVQSDDNLVRRAIGRNVFDVTVPDPTHSPIVAMLDVQYRMHPAIGALVGTQFYGGRLVHSAEGVDAIALGAPFPGRALVVVDVPSQCERSPKGTSRVNRISAARTVELALEAVHTGSTSIAVITPYAAQAADIRKRLADLRMTDVVDCNTIHRFQGRECDIVIIDLVDAYPMRPSGLLTDAPNLLNVSVSRARGKLVIVADVAYFQASDPNGLVTRLLRAAMA